jgi:acyl carrier protein
MSITEKIFQIINEKFRPAGKGLTQDDMDKDLFGLEFDICARDIMVLFCELEKVFNIKITEKKFEMYGFRTIRNISELVQNSL